MKTSPQGTGETSQAITCFYFFDYFTSLNILISSSDKIGNKSQISKTEYKACQLAYIEFNAFISN